MTPLRIFIGYDPREAVAYHVLAHSLLARATQPISITPLVRQALYRVHRRPRGPKESTDFAFTRFLVPYLSCYEGFSVFMDCDMLARCDIGDVLLYTLSHPGKALYVCQHDYTPKTSTKFLGQPQMAYPRKNWSSFMLFDNAQCTALTPDFVDSATGLELHRFTWLRDNQIGSLPLTWNWLVGEYEPNPAARVLHYTLGTPCFPDYSHCDQSDPWWVEYGAMLEPTKAMIPLEAVDFMEAS